MKPQARGPDRRINGQNQCLIVQGQDMAMGPEGRRQQLPELCVQGGEGARPREQRGKRSAFFQQFFDF